MIFVTFVAVFSVPSWPAHIIVFVAVLAPFRALRPAPSAAAHVAAVPYDVVTTEEARALAAAEPLSFLRVSRPEIDFPAGVDPHSNEAYERAATNMAALVSAAPFVTEDEPSLYVYRLRMGGHEQTGIAGCFAVDDYERDIVRKHERTRRDKEDDRTRHILALRAQSGPALLAFRAPAAVRHIIAHAIVRPPLYDFEAADRVRHTIVRCESGETSTLVDLFANIPALYIADGHHRAAAAARARAQLRLSGDASKDADTFLAVAFPHDEMQVLPYHRVVRDLGPRSPHELLEAIRRRGEVHDGTATPARRGEVAMYLDGQWHTIVLGGSTELTAGGSADLAPDERLDVSRLQRDVLAPLLGIGDVRSDPRIDFVGGARGTAELERLVRSGEAAVAFSMYPVSVEEIMRISDAGGIMPPKSSWFEPKLRDGVLVHVI